MVQGNISQISDSMIIINTLEPVYLSRIAAVYRSRALLHRFSSAGIVAGIGYFLLSGFNRAINKESPVISNGTVPISAAVAGSGVVTSFFHFRKFTIGSHWRRPNGTPRTMASRIFWPCSPLPTNASIAGVCRWGRDKSC